MRVFVTGATGFVGSAVVNELIDAGHNVLGLARSETGAASLAATGAEVHRGSLDDLESLKRGVAKADAVIHTAFNHDFSKFKASCEADRGIIEALGAPLAGSSRPLIVTSATGLLASPRLATESDLPAPDSPNPRVASEQAAASLAARGVNVSLMRLPPSVHGDGDHGFVPLLIDIARKQGEAAFVGDGANLWPAVHRLDAARLYRLALEHGARAPHYHAVAEEGVPMRDIANVIGRRLNLPIVSKTKEEAAEHFGWFAHFAALNNPSSSHRTRELLGWQPTHQGLIADLEGPGYFKR
jgi:nucleoside-diphosphate-sugar epimerase